MHGDLGQAVQQLKRAISFLTPMLSPITVSRDAGKEASSTSANFLDRLSIEGYPNLP
jgi:hypothetical protein